MTSQRSQRGAGGGGSQACVRVRSRPERRPTATAHSPRFRSSAAPATATPSSPSAPTPALRSKLVTVTPSRPRPRPPLVPLPSLKALCNQALRSPCPLLILHVTSRRHPPHQPIGTKFRGIAKIRTLSIDSLLPRRERESGSRANIQQKNTNGVLVFQIAGGE
jgi:hypothetical protein